MAEAVAEGSGFAIRQNECLIARPDPGLQDLTPVYDPGLRRVETRIGGIFSGKSVAEGDCHVTTLLAMTGTWKPLLVEN